MKSKILLVEDEVDVLEVNARLLKRRGYEVLLAKTVLEAKEILTQTTPDLLILDIILPDGNGYDICKNFRKISNNPVIFLSGKDSVSDKIEGLEKGGDYYLTKPYHIDEVLAVISRLLQKHFINCLEKGALTLDLLNKKAFVDKEDVHLTTKEYALLEYLINHEEQEISSSELYEKVWGLSAVNDTRTIRFHMSNLRKKIKAEERKGYHILSTYGKGYKFSTRL